MVRIFQCFASGFGFLGVAVGAFGAHALKQRISESNLAIFQTGVQYHFIHALALLLTALWMAQTPKAALLWAGWFFIGGILLFSGSLYALALTDIRVLGAVTPVGGLAFLAAWACLLVAAATG